MNKNLKPEDLAIALLNRSRCMVQVAAVLVDTQGVFSWGWNHEGPDGFGMHAEDHCMRRANPRRIREATLYVVAQRARNKKMVPAKPCEDCSRIVQRCKRIIYRNSDGMWVKEN